VAAMVGATVVATKPLLPPAGSGVES